MMLAALAALAIVTHDQTALRSAPRESAVIETTLWQGDSLELRGARLDYLQVYDHRRERAGYVRAEQVRPTALGADAAPELLSVMRFLRDTPGEEALGIAYAAAYLKAVPAERIDAEPFDAIATMAERLAVRASEAPGKLHDARSAEHLETARSYGVHFDSYDRDGRVQTCYDGEASRRVLALAAEPMQKARAALALTRPECVDPALGPLQRAMLDDWRAQVLDRVELEGLSGAMANRLRVRRAGVWAQIAFERTRMGKDAHDAGQRALDELAGVDREEIAERDREAYTEAAVRVGASRWAAAAVPPAAKGLHLVTAPGEPGQNCVVLVDARHDEAAPLARRCTYGTVWLASAAVSPGANAVALAVQPLHSWREVWLFRRVGGEWRVGILPPSADEPDVGYVEFAGWVRGGERVLVAREVRSGGHWRRSFEVIRPDTFATERRASDPTLLGAFYRWGSPRWRHETVSLR